VLQQRGELRKHLRPGVMESDHVIECPGVGVGYLARPLVPTEVGGVEGGRSQADGTPPEVVPLLRDVLPEPPDRRRYDLNPLAPVCPRRRHDLALLARAPPGPPREELISTR
jgi:hypothetical protein